MPRARRYWTAAPVARFREATAGDSERTYYIMDGSELAPTTDLRELMARLNTIVAEDSDPVETPTEEPSTPEALGAAVLNSHPDRLRDLDDEPGGEDAALVGGGEDDDGLSLSQRIAEAAVAPESVDPSEDANGATRWMVFRYVPSPRGMHEALTALLHGAETAPTFRVRVHQRFTF